MGALKPIKRTGSHAGFHFMNLYQCCPRKFWYRYVMGWRKEKIATPLVLGSAFHEAKAEWYKKKSLRKCLETGLEIIEESRPEMESEEAYKWSQRRLDGLFRGWVDAFGESDRVAFDVVAVEKELKVPIADTGYVMTIRPDAILRSKASGLTVIMETKTSGFSHRLTEEAVAFGDQATSYLLGVQRVMGLEVFGVQTDIAYWNKQSVDPNNRKYLRPNVIFRSQQRLEEYEAGVAQLLMEMTQKVNAVKHGYDPKVLFPRNSFYCLSYGAPCEYAEVCGGQRTRIPQGFIKERREKIGALVADQIVIK